MAGVKQRRHSGSDVHSLHEELDEISCPICMDHPHNAVLLLCSSHDKGCRSYICDTSYRHSNCFDRFKQLRESSRCDANSPNPAPIISSYNTSDTSLTLIANTIGANGNNNRIENSSVTSVEIAEGGVVNSIQDSTRQFGVERGGVLEAGDPGYFHERIELEQENTETSSDLGSDLKCPLCRGAILGWKVVEEARKYLNLKNRSCSSESCSFLGNYQELRRHARRVHPTTRPSDIDPSRQQAWRCLEHQREYGDIVSAVRSAMPGAVVVGDYVIENGDRIANERGSGAGEVGAPWWTTFFLVQMIGSSMGGLVESRSRSRGWTRHRSSTGPFPERRLLWGENLLGLQHDDDNNDDDGENDLHMIGDASEDASPVPRRRRRRRLTRSRSNDQS